MMSTRLVLVRHEGTVRLEVTCACGELARLDPLEPYGKCVRCGVDLDPDPGDVLPMGNA